MSCNPTRLLSSVLARLEFYAGSVHSPILNRPGIFIEPRKILKRMGSEIGQPARGAWWYRPEALKLWDYIILHLFGGGR